MLETAVVFHGVVAILIILVVLAIVGTGVYTVLRGAGRGAKKLADHASGKDDRRV